MDDVVRSPGDGIAVRTTSRGLPVALSFAESELSRAPGDLAEDVLKLCRLSAARMQVALRLELAARGVPSPVIGNLDLCTAEDLARAIAEVHAPGDEPGEGRDW